jgi:hypothetical protein
LRRLPALLLAMALLWACDDPPEPGKGGLLTAQLWTEAMVADAKLAECTGTAGLLGAWVRLGQTDSMPITDGAEAQRVKEFNSRISGVLAAKDCAGVMEALNDGVTPGACTAEGGTCQGDVLQECLAMGALTLRFDTDCRRLNMTCVGGACTLGTCVTNACDGDTLVTCGEDKRKAQFLCGALGLTCGNSGDGLQCVGRGETCTTVEDDDPNTAIATLPRCDSGRLTWCLGGHKAILDCGALTDDRRECKQASLDKFVDLPPLEILTKHLLEACGPTGADCEGDARECEEDDYLKICVDGYYEWMTCRDYHTGACGTSTITAGQPACVPFPRP